MPTRRAFVGVADHAGWAVLVTVDRDGKFLDRRRIELLDAGLPSLPYHHDAQALPLAEAEALLERVRASAERNAAIALGALQTSVPMDIVGIAIRECPPLPPTIDERLRDYRAQNVADTAMYRQEIARAADALGWTVRWYDARKVISAAGLVLGVKDAEAHFAELRDTLGPPWTKDHRVAMAAAITSVPKARS